MILRPVTGARFPVSAELERRQRIARLRLKLAGKDIDRESELKKLRLVSRKGMYP